MLFVSKGLISACPEYLCSKHHGLNPLRRRVAAYVNAPGVLGFATTPVSPKSSPESNTMITPLMEHYHATSLPLRVRLERASRCCVVGCLEGDRRGRDPPLFGASSELESTRALTKENRICIPSEHIPCVCSYHKFMVRQLCWGVRCVPAVLVGWLQVQHQDESVGRQHVGLAYQHDLICEATVKRAYVCFPLSDGCGWECSVCAPATSCKHNTEIRHANLSETQRARAISCKRSR